MGQANNMFWLLMNELQDRDEGVDLGEVYGRWSGGYEGDRFETVIIWVNAKKRTVFLWILQLDRLK